MEEEDTPTRLQDESAWVKTLIPQLEEAIRETSTEVLHPKVSDRKRLAYRYEVSQYSNSGNPKTKATTYQTDVLVWDEMDGDLWIPRVVIECKLAHLTTHDAITYSNKAATHKEVHPYLRYGILIGKLGAKGVPKRLFRHGASFDFMMVWRGESASPDEWVRFIEMLRAEIQTSRKIECLINGKPLDGDNYSLVHRPLVLQ
ncbi:MAG: hypothetical protein ABFD89_13440 [Bryobacteraceae bacterium]